MNRPGWREAAVYASVGLIAALVVAVPATASPVSSKQAQAQQVLQQINAIDVNLERVVQAYDTAQTKLDTIVARQQLNQKLLAVARSNYAKAQAQLSSRLVDLYTSGDQSALEVLLGSVSLTDLVNRIDTVNRVSDQDARVVRQIVSFRAEIKRREAELAQARAAQEKIVAQKQAEKRTIEAKLAERRRLLSSIKSEIARLQRAEAAQQQRLQAAAEQRLQGDTSGSGTPIGDPGPSRYGGVVGIAMQYLGVPYVWGGASPSGFDCSGLVMYVFAQVGVSLPHSSYAQFGMGTPVSRSALEPGDLVFFAGASHVGIYIGGGQFIHAPHTGSVVSIASLSGWYSSSFAGARRL